MLEDDEDKEDDNDAENDDGGDVIEDADFVAVDLDVVDLDDIQKTR